MTADEKNRAQRAIAGRAGGAFTALSAARCRSQGHVYAVGWRASARTVRSASRTCFRLSQNSEKYYAKPVFYLGEVFRLT
jgi:hypothetical protein